MPKSVYKKLYKKHGDTMRTGPVGELLHMHPTHVRELAKRGELPGIRIGSRWVFPTRKIAALIEEADAYVGD